MTLLLFLAPMPPGLHYVWDYWFSCKQGRCLKLQFFICIQWSSWSFLQEICLPGDTWTFYQAKGPFLDLTISYTATKDEEESFSDKCLKFDDISLKTMGMILGPPSGKNCVSLTLKYNCWLEDLIFIVGLLSSVSDQKIEAKWSRVYNYRSREHPFSIIYWCALV